jgi:hypothetical protein
MNRTGLACLAGLVGLLAAPGDARQDSTPRPDGVSEIVLDGTLTRANRGTYMLRDFTVPPDVKRIDVSFSYTGTREEGTELEIGLFDPEKFRGTSRFSKKAFFITAHRATPSYYPGAIVPGRWQILLALPSIRDAVTSRYTVTVRLRSGPTADGPSDDPPPGAAPQGPAWFKGDLHGHTMHSDGFGCRDAVRERRGCGVSELVQAGARRGLQFMAITDHNTTSHHAELMGLQEVFSDLLLIRGQELTTFHGHANIYGTSEPIDYRLGFQGYSVADAMQAAERAGALFSINHPGRTTGETCTGCGWDAPGTDYARLRSMEVVNSTRAEGPASGAIVWHQHLNRGLRITGIGGSDDHGAGSRQPAAGAGTPTTVVYAARLTEAAILDGVRAGHVYIKTRGPEGPDLYLTARDAAGRQYMAGDVLPAGDAVELIVEVRGGSGQRLEVIRRGEIDQALSRALPSDDYRDAFTIRAAPGDWLRLNLRDDKGLTALTNPLYFRAP